MRNQKQFSNTNKSILELSYLIICGIIFTWILR